MPHEPRDASRGAPRGRPMRRPRPSVTPSIKPSLASFLTATLRLKRGARGPFRARQEDGSWTGFFGEKVRLAEVTPRDVNAFVQWHDAERARNLPRLPQPQRHWPTLIGRIRHVPPLLGFIADIGGAAAVGYAVGRFLGLW